VLIALATFAVLLLLVACGVLAWHVVRLTRARQPAPEQLMLRMAELEAEFAAMADAQSRFLKRLSKRDRDSSRQLVEGTPTADQLPPRERARQKLAAFRLTKAGGET